MSRLMVTGASGYIGRRLCALASDIGWDVVVLGRAPLDDRIVRRFDWRLGEEIPQSAFDGVKAVIHLAHSWNSDGEQRTSSTNINLAGTEKLARAALAADVPRFIFASTTSARPEALNSYGRIKYAVEKLLISLPTASNRVDCARIGLVYGGPEIGQYGLLSKLVRLLPLLPMVALNRKVQPIYLDEVVAGLLALAKRPATSIAPVIAGPVPIAFGKFLQMLRRAHVGKRLILVPIPLRVALLACDLTSLAPFVLTVDRERILGLAGTSPMESTKDLADLGISIVPPIQRFARLRTPRRQLIAEARAMLAYVSGQPTVPRTSTARLVRALDRQGAQPLWILRFLLSLPWLLRVFEPFRVRMDHSLAMRLHLAVMVDESVCRDNRSRSNAVSLVGLAVLEVALIPLRLVLGRVYA